MILTPGLIISNNIVINGGHPIGQVEFTTPGTYSWVAPNGVSQVHVVAVGGGGNGRVLGSNPAGGAGGGLGWKNNIPVNAGTAYTVQVGSASGNSYFINATVVCGFGAIIVSGTTSTQANALGGSFVGDGGGHGGNVGSYTASYAAGIETAYPSGGGAGGAGGYTGPGGDGARRLDGSGPGSSGMYYGTNGAGGGGAGGHVIDGFGVGGSGAGGVGIYGIGPSGRTSYGITNIDGQSPGQGVLPQGGSNGQSGSGHSGNGGAGGKYGGGGGGGGGGGSAGGTGGSGAVRIIWGDNRRFPNINTANILQTF